jgi:hypothetical protein
MALYNNSVLPTNIDPTPSQTATITTVAVGNTAAQVLAANASRKGFSIYNNSNRILYIGTTNSVAVSSGLFAIIPANSLYEWSMASIYTGAVFAIANGTNGSAQVFELTP